MVLSQFTLFIDVFESYGMTLPQAHFWIEMTINIIKESIYFDL